MNPYLYYFLVVSAILFWIVFPLILVVAFFWSKGQLTEKLKKYGFRAVASKGIDESMQQLYSELPKDVKRETLASLSSNLIKRITRLGAWRITTGLATVILAAITPFILLRQNNLIEDQTKLFSEQTKIFQEQSGLIKNQTDILDRQDLKLGVQNDLLLDQNSKIAQQTQLFQKQNDLVGVQNLRLDIQNNLMEAERRGALVLIMSNLFDQIDVEIKEQKQRDSLKRKDFELSEILIARISSLSQSLLPYRILKEGKLTKELISPERGQLLLTLVKSKLSPDTYAQIYSYADFSYSYLENMDLSGADLHWAELQNSKLNGASLANANLDLTHLEDADLENAKLFNAELTATYFDGANLRNAKLNGSNLSSSSFNYANLTSASLVNCSVGGTSFVGAILDYTNLYGLKSVNLKNLAASKSIFNPSGIDLKLLENLQNLNPCLFTKSGCKIAPRK